MHRHRGFSLLAGWLTLVCVPAIAQQDDVTFFVIGKHANYKQNPAGELEPVDFSFFSEIFLKTEGDADNAFLNMPTGERIRFRDQRQVDGPDRDNLLLIRGARRFDSYAELQSWYPDGAYNIAFDTPSGSVDQSVLRFPENGLPTPPKIALRQNDRLLCGIADSRQDISVSWSEFAQGGADENAILDDLIFVIVEDQSGHRVSHSGRPFEGRPFLTYRNTRHTIDAGALKAGHEYTLSVEHAVLTDTQKTDEVPAMTTYAVTSKLTFTTAAAQPALCAAAQRKERDMRPTTDAQVVMFYYKDLAEADRFYGEILGLEKTLDEDWVKFYQTSVNGTVGLVAEGDGAWHKVQDKNSVMLSIVTSEVDAWYELLRQNDELILLKEIGDGGPVRSFLLEDPGGYTVEFFEWLR